jgi:membrane-bound ClpP family serine protease
VTDTTVAAAIAVAVLILVIVGVVRVVQRRRGQEGAFGAGGSRTVPLGTRGLTKTSLVPSGVVYAAGEEWTARSGSGATIASGEQVQVTGQDGLTLIVEIEPLIRPTQE